MSTKMVRFSQLSATVVILALVLSVSALPAPSEEDTQIVHRRPIRSVGRYCGENLTEALKLVCYSKYNTPAPKRTNNFDEWYPNIGNPFGIKNDLDGEIRFKNKRESEFSSSNTDEVDRSYLYRQIRGVHDECCKKPCTLRQMKQYCMAEKRSHDSEYLLDYNSV